MYGTRAKYNKPRVAEIGNVKNTSWMKHANTSR